MSTIYLLPKLHRRGRCPLVFHQERGINVHTAAAYRAYLLLPPFQNVYKAYTPEIPAQNKTTEYTSNCSRTELSAIIIWQSFGQYSGSRLFGVIMEYESKMKTMFKTNKYLVRLLLHGVCSCFAYCAVHNKKQLVRTRTWGKKKRRNTEKKKWHWNYHDVTLKKRMTLKLSWCNAEKKNDTEIIITWVLPWG